MIRLTSKYTNNVWYVNPDHIISIGCINGGTTVELTTDIETDAVRHVTESPEEVARKVLEWKLAMIDYHHDIPSVKKKAMVELAKLAGLEEPNHDT